MLRFSWHDGPYTYHGLYNSGDLLAQMENSMARDFTESIYDLAQKLCIGVSTFGPLIEKNWGSDPAVMAALTWARVACTIAPNLRDALDDAGSGDPIPSDPSTWPGVDPSAPPPAPLPE